jgi:hypothetical protein
VDNPGARGFEPFKGAFRSERQMRKKASPKCKARSKPKQDIVMLTWLDSANTSGWHPEDESGPVTIKSIGLLVNETREFIVISTSKSDQGRYMDQLTIPRSVVKKIQVFQR